MKLNIFLIIVLSICMQNLTIRTADLQALQAERELHRLVKIKLHGEPVKLVDYNNAVKTIAFSPDGKHLAVASTPGPVLIYDIAAEKAKRFDRELEKMKEEAQASELSSKLEA